MTDPLAIPKLIKPDGASALACGERNATSANSGTMSRSSYNKIDTMRCPRGCAISPRSVNSCITMAVEVSTNPAAAMNATRGSKPRAMPTPVSAPLQTAICNVL